jgi:hypothetical protein
MGQSDSGVTEDQLASIYQKHLAKIEAWLARQTNLDVIYVDYNTLLKDPSENLTQVQAFLNGDLDIEKMCSVIDRNLYRQRNHKTD